MTFYANRQFQAKFIKVVNPTATIIDTMWWTVLNAFVSLVGLYAAAFTVDSAWMGRRRMQLLGFGWVTLMFFLCE